MAFTKAATVAEIPPGKGKQLTLNGKVIALFHTASGFYAIDDTCPHRGASLAEGELEGTEVVCPWHNAWFDLTTGANLTPPAPKGVGCYKVQVVGDEVQVDVP
jgi:nitrite reductase/ring-hydroxylating ferredoxin subunit